MVTSPTGKGVIIIGGSTAPFEFSKAMFELSQSIEWTRLEQTLKVEHFASLAIPIPDELVNKIVKSEDKEQGRSLKENKNKNKLEK